MKEQIFKIYNDGAEFLDDLYWNKLKIGLTDDEFEDFIYNDITSIGDLRIERNTYNLLQVGSSEQLRAVNLSKTLIGWYKDWEKHQ